MPSTRRRSTQPTDEIARVMGWPVAVVPGGASLVQVAEELAGDGIGAVAVLVNDHLAGVVSERDLVHHLAQGSNPDHVTAADVMSTDLVTARPEDRIVDTARRMADAQVRHLPVVDEDTIVGFVSMRDLFEVLLHVVAPADEPDLAD